MIESEPRPDLSRFFRFVWLDRASYSQAMRRLRVFLFLLLAIAIPLQGYAHFAQPWVSCPMEEAAMTAMVDAAAHDCCGDQDPAGKICKSGQPCQSVGQHFVAPAIDALPQMAAAATRYPRVAMRAIAFDPSATWRPPAQF